MKGLIWYLVKRVLSVLIVVLLIASAVFVAFFLVGDPVRTFVPRGGSQEWQERIILDMKLNDPLYAQYLNFMVKTLSGRFFDSIGTHHGVPIGSFIYDSLWKTLALFAAVLIPALIVGHVLGGLFSGRRESMLLSRFARLVSLGLASASIVSAALLLWYCYVKVGTMPSRDSIIPPLVVSFPIAVGTYVLLMKGKERHFGSPWKSPTPASDRPIPATSITKLYVAWVMVIVLVAETLFGYRGLGWLAQSASWMRDMTLLMTFVFLVAVAIAFTNFALDIISPFIRSWFSKRQEPGEQAAPATGAETKSSPESTENLGGGAILKMVVRDYIKRPLGVAALAIVLAILVLGVFAPLLATVPNPDYLVSREPNHPFDNPPLNNPLPPSFDRSGSTGFIHPLGTDSIGRDVYSELLYGAIAPVMLTGILVAITLTLGVIVWVAAIFASRLQGVNAMLVGGFSSVVADAVIAAPLFVILIARSYSDGGSNDSVPISLASLVLLVWACTFGIVRVKMPALRRLGSSQRVPGTRMSTLRAVMPKAGGSILYVSKFVVLFGFLTVIAIPVFLPVTGHIFQTSWAELSYETLDRGSVTMGSWWLIVPQLVLTALLVGSAYKALDTLEQVMVRRFGTLK